MRLTHRHPFLMGAVLCAAVLSCGKEEKPVPATARLVPASTATPADSAVTISIAGVQTEVTFTRLDMGQILDVFDGKRESMARTENATTAVIDLAFQGALEASSLEVITGTMDVGLEVTLTLADKPEPLVFSTKLVQQTTEPTVRLDFGGTQKFKRARVEITNLNGGDGHIHIYEVVFK